MDNALKNVLSYDKMKKDKEKTPIRANDWCSGQNLEEFKSNLNKI